MNLTNATLAAVLLALWSVGSACAWGQGGPQVRFGVAVGGPYRYGPGYYSPYYYSPYYYPPAYYPPVQVSPPVYVERSEAQPASAPPEQAYWYYCAEAKGYYPYVQECPGGWQPVSPQPPPR